MLLVNLASLQERPVLFASHNISIVEMVAELAFSMQSVAKQRHGQPQT